MYPSQEQGVIKPVDGIVKTDNFYRGITKVENEEPKSDPGNQVGRPEPFALYLFLPQGIKYRRWQQNTRPGHIGVDLGFQAKAVKEGVEDTYPYKEKGSEKQKPPIGFFMQVGAEYIIKVKEEYKIVHIVDQPVVIAEKITEKETEFVVFVDKASQQFRQESVHK